MKGKNINVTKTISCAVMILLVLVCLGITPLTWAQDKSELAKAAKEDKKPNILFVLMDNLGYGEIGSYGGGMTRGAPTPSLDRLASEGLRLTNFNVEAQCTPSRSAIMTGRHPIRSGTFSVPPPGLPYGLVQWEVTLAELLKDQGYNTAIYGKWHLGNSVGRYPTDQGFDEWYGIPNSTDESLWPEQTYYDRNDIALGKVPPMTHIMESHKGETPRQVKVYDINACREIDLEITEKTIDFMNRSVKEGKPFYAYIAFTLVHYPTLPSQKFVGKTGNGDWADALAQIDWCSGRILDAVDELGIRDDTIVVFTSDNGPEEKYGYRGWSGPWSGSYFTAFEGSNRVPFIIRWPDKIRAGRVSDEIVHEVDTFTTFAKISGAVIPSDRPIDGVDQTDFFFGKQEKSNRDGFPIFGSDLYAIKWRNWKLHLVWQERMDSPALKLGLPRLYNLYMSPQERADEGLTNLLENLWVLQPIEKIINDFERSLKEYPPIPTGTPDPYMPPNAKK